MKAMVQECEKIRGRFVAYLYDDLAEPKAAVIREHLAQCESCASELDALYKTREAVEWYKLSVPVNPLPNDFTERMWETIEYRGIRQDRHLWKKPPFLIAAAAALVIAFGLAVNVPNYLGRDMSGQAGFINPLTRPDPTPTPNLLPTPARPLNAE